MQAARLISAAVVVALLSGCGGGGETAVPAPSARAFRVETVTSATFPVRMAFAPDGRLFFNELQTGDVRIWQNGTVQAQPFVSLNVAINGELGLLGIALDPNFAANAFV